MSHIRIQRLSIENYRSFGDIQEFEFPNADYLKPVSIIGYNNTGKSNFLNSLLYGIGEKFVSAKTFELLDLHNLDLDNNIRICTSLDGSDYAEPNYRGDRQTIAGNYQVYTSLENGDLKSNCTPTFFGKGKYYNIFYINFHNIKEEISTQKTSWGI